ncbi:MAG: ComEC/Rec2 family competence protein [Deltaproteobacteria bacterium]|nr:ComEC/Rec2 family competence protein [Deltaproteobacteria bacterium]
MCWLLLLLVAFSVGVLRADLGGARAAAVAVSWSDALFARAALFGSVASGIGTVAVVLVACASPELAGRLARQHGLRGLAAALLIGLTFAAGHRSLERELIRAERGAALAAGFARRTRAGGAPLHFVDARVVARRATGFGEEVELGDLRGRVGEGALPERVLLSWSREAPFEPIDEDRVGDGPSRAEVLLWPGARVRLAIRLEPLRPTRNPGSPDRERAWARRGIGARARLVKPDWVVETVSDAEPFARVASELVALRRGAVEQARRRLPSDAPGAGLVRALALGDRRDLSEATRRCFRALGLTHLLSVSGLHIGFVAVPAAAAVARLRVLVRPRRRPVLGFGMPIAVGCGVALGYGWLTGGSVPALRAGLLFGLFGIARLGRSTLAPGPALAAVGLALLVADPAVLFDPGARFSFSACVALLAARLWGTSPESASDAAVGAASASARASLPDAQPVPARERFGAIAAVFVDPVRASLAVSLALLPWVELEGLPRSLLSPLVNALAIPWTGFVVMPGALAACVLAWGLPEARGELLLRALIWPAAALEGAAAWLGARLPSSVTGADQLGLIPWPVGLALIALGFFALRRGRVVVAGLVWLALGGLGLVPVREVGFAEERPRLVFFDVGQADAALIETRDAIWLIDSGSGPGDGSGGGTLLRALRALAIDRLDGLVITHGDLDHRGGARRLLSALPVGELWLPALPRPDADLVALAAEASERGVRVVWVGAGDRHRSGRTLEFDVLWPPRAAIAKQTSEHEVGGFGEDARLAGRARNEHSIVLRASIEGRDLLFMADVGAGVEQRLRSREQLAGVELLKLGHHGSRRSSDAAFLEVAAPALALVSAPCDAARGLPSPVALARVRAAGVGLAWTGRDGAIAVGWTEDGDRRVESWGRPRACAERDAESDWAVGGGRGGGGG